MTSCACCKRLYQVKEHVEAFTMLLSTRGPLLPFVERLSMPELPWSLNKWTAICHAPSDSLMWWPIESRNVNSAGACMCRSWWPSADHRKPKCNKAECQTPYLQELQSQHLANILWAFARVRRVGHCRVRREALRTAVCLTHWLKRITST